jgi:hypothetical protein
LKEKSKVPTFLVSVRVAVMSLIAPLTMKEKERQKKLDR